jgi:hypothetical protein
VTLDALAEKHRLKVTRDECNDKIIQGRKGHLYMDGHKLCAMWLEARVSAQTLAPLGGRQWVGDYELVARKRGNQRLRDAKVVGITADKVGLAIRLTGAKIKRVMSEAQRAALAKAQAASPLNLHKKKQP